jgi:predicted nicotinamide N-methyase
VGTVWVVTAAAVADFIGVHTRLRPVPFVPELRLHLADDAIALWERMERDTGRTGLPVPFWAFAWAGGQALARYVLDHPDVVAGRRVLDVASGSGLVAVAAALAGADMVTAADVDPYAGTATGMNARANGVDVHTVLGDVLDGDGDGAQVVLAGDVFYERDMGARMLAFLRRARARGAAVLVGDPGRAFLPRGEFTAVAAYDVPVPRALEDADHRHCTVWALPR